MITTTDPFKSPSRKKSGFTMVELLVAIAIGSLFLGVAASCLNLLGRNSVAVGNYADMNASSRRALERFATDVRMAVDVIVSSKTALVFWRYNDSFNLVRVGYWYDASKGEVYRIFDGKISTVLMDVDAFGFEYYDLTHSSTTNALSVKEVEINASLERKVMNISNTNEIISARFMMRNRQVSS